MRAYEVGLRTGRCAPAIAYRALADADLAVEVAEALTRTDGVGGFDAAGRLLTHLQDAGRPEAAARVGEVQAALAVGRRGRPHLVRRRLLLVRGR